MSNNAKNQFNAGEGSEERLVEERCPGRRRNFSQYMSVETAFHTKSRIPLRLD